MNGRPTKFREEFVEQAEKIYALGATDKKAADFFGVDEATVNRWKESHKDFCESIKKGRKKFDDEAVEGSLLRRATGATVTEVKENSLTGEIITTTKELPPDTGAAIFWLRNRKHKDWDGDGETTKAPVVTIKYARDEK